MIYDYNTIGFYSIEGNRQYDNTDNVRVLHHFVTNNIPSFQLVLAGTITAATYQLLDVNGVEVSNGSVTVENDTNEALTAYSRLIFLGATLSSKDDGFYSIKITYDTSNYIYSDLFCWKTDVSEYLKIVATSSDIMIGEFELNLTGFTYTVYLEAKNYRESYEIEEEGIEKTYGNLPLFNSRNHISEFDITGYKKTLNFLSGLRAVWTNGVVTITYNGDSYEIYDIENAEAKDTYGNSDIMLIGLKCKIKDYLQTRNTI